LTRPLLVAGTAVGALALWVWLTGPGTSLWLALGGGLFAVLAGRLAYGLLTPRGEAQPHPAARAEKEERDV